MVTIDYSVCAPTMYRNTFFLLFAGFSGYVVCREYESPRASMVCTCTAYITQLQINVEFVICNM